MPAPLLACGPWRLLRFLQDQPLIWPSLLSADEIAARLEAGPCSSRTGPEWTLIVPADRPLGADLGLEARQRLVRFSERLSCATLAQLSLETHTDFRCPDPLRIRMQHWQSAQSVPAAVPLATGMPAPAANDHRRSLAFDVDLLQALIELDRMPAGQTAAIDKALQAYGLALAQAERLIPVTALMLLGAALRSLLACEDYDATLRDRLLAEIALLSGPDPGERAAGSSDPATGLLPGRLLREWLDDLFGCLGRSGQGDPLRGGNWAARSHLRLLGFLFPLLLKARLARLGLYRISGTDIALVGCFERLTAAEPHLLGARRAGLQAPLATAASIVQGALTPDPQVAAFEDALAWCINRNLLMPDP